MKVTDEKLLELIESGDIELTLDAPEFVTVFGRRVKAYRIGMDDQHRYPERARWSFAMRIEGKRRTIVRAKLVWMVGARRVVPKGFEVHHLNGDNLDDRWQNLVAVLTDDHRKVEAWEEYREVCDSEPGEIPF